MAKLAKLNTDPIVKLARQFGFCVDLCPCNKAHHIHMEHMGECPIYIRKDSIISSRVMSIKKEAKTISLFKTSPEVQAFIGELEELLGVEFELSFK